MPLPQVKLYDPEKLSNGFNTLESGEEVYFIQAPAQGLWAAKQRFEGECQRRAGSLMTARLKGVCVEAGNGDG